MYLVELSPISTVPLSWYWKANGDLDLVTRRTLNFCVGTPFPTYFAMKQVYLDIGGAGVGRCLF